MKDAYYFSHDSNARNDIKIKAMRKEYGAIGYAAYWMIVEMLREADGYKLPLKFFTYDAINEEVNLESFTAEKFINDCLNKYELFKSDDQHFWSESLLRRMQKKDETNIKRKNAAKARWDKEKEDQGQEIDIHMQCNNNANAIQDYAKESKVKESKVKESKGKKKENNKDEEANVFKFYEDNGFGILSPHIRDLINNWIDDGMDESIILLALQIAVINDARKWNYVDTLLLDWHNKNFKTVEEVQTHIKQFQLNKQSRERGQPNKPIKKEKVPDYIKNQEERYNEDNKDIGSKTYNEKMKNINRLLEKLGEKK